MPLTQAQAKAVQDLMNNVELAYRAVQRSKTALSALIAVGQATCNDIRTFNLVVKSTYFYQKSAADLIRANGVQAPDIPPPLYVVWKGIPGDQAINIDCSTGQLKGWQATGRGDFFVNPRDVEWRQGAVPGDNQEIAAAVARAAKIPAMSSSELRGPLGVGPIDIVALIIVGIVLYVAGSILLKMVEAFTGVTDRVEYTKQMAIAAQAHSDSLEKRKKCYDDCIARGGTTEDCAKNCARLNPDFTPPDPGGGLGIFGKILAGVAVIGVGIVIFRVVQNRMRLHGGSGGGSTAHHSRQLPSGSHAHHHEDAGDEDAIDAEYTES